TRIECDDVLTDSHKQLWRGLSADSTADVWFAGEHGREMLCPSLGNRVAVKHDALFSGLRSTEHCVGVAITRQIRPVDAIAFLLVLQIRFATGSPSRCSRGIQW